MNKEFDIYDDGRLNRIEALLRQAAEFNPPVGAPDDLVIRALERRRKRRRFTALPALVFACGACAVALLIIAPHLRVSPKPPQLAASGVPNVRTTDPPAPEEVNPTTPS